jgi:hypothetical protein
MRLNKRTIAGLGMKILGKGLLEMGKETMNENNVIDFDANEAAEIKLMISQIKNLLQIQASDFSEQYIKKQEAKGQIPEYMINDDFGVQIVESGIGNLIKMTDWDDEEMLSLAAHCLMSVIIENVNAHFSDEEDEEYEETE